MKKTILSLLLLLVSAVAFAGNWVPITNPSNGIKMYFDPDSITKRGSDASIRMMLVPPVPNNIANDQIKSVISTYLFNCFSKEVRLINMITYDQPDGTGRVLSSSQEDFPPIPILPKSPYASVQTFLCK